MTEQKKMKFSKPLDIALQGYHVVNYKADIEYDFNQEAYDYAKENGYLAKAGKASAAEKKAETTETLPLADTKAE